MVKPPKPPITIKLQPTQASPKVILKVLANSSNLPELELKFSVHTYCINWHYQITELAKSVGLDLSKYIERKDCTLQIKASPGRWFGVYIRDAQPDTHFAQQQLAINFAAPKLRDYFISSLNFKKEENEILTYDGDPKRGSTIYFLKLPPKANNTLERLVNVPYMADLVIEENPNKSAANLFSM
jgi:hypothetical protein